MATKITSAEKAVQAIKEISDVKINEKSKGEKAYAVADYIKQKSFRTIVDRNVGTASVRDYYAGLYNPGSGNIVSFQPTQPAAAAHHHDPATFASIKVWYVPTVSIDSLLNNNKQFPPGTLATVDVLAHAQPPFICTEKLTGCCFVIGWDEKNGRLYLGHIQPSEKYDRTYIAKYVRDNEVLPVPKSQLKLYVCFGGDDNKLPSAYNNYTVNIVGFILSNRVWMVFQFQHGKERGSLIWDLQKK